MAAMSKTWWGERFLDALAEFTDSGRLQRGRAYAKDHRILAWKITKGVVKADIRGNVNPYFGVYKEPVYKTTVQMRHLSEAQWKKIIAQLSNRATFIAKLLVNEIPESIEALFAEFNSHLLPKSYQDFNVSCDCPDYAVPCKHIAGVCYRLAAEFDHNPLLLFEMRGLPPKKLHQELIKSPLGKVLASSQDLADVQFPMADSFFTRPEPESLPKQITLKAFWQGQVALPKELPPHQEATLPAALIKKGGDFPQFWQKQSSFIAVMEDFYLRMRKNNQKML